MSPIMTIPGQTYDRERVKPGSYRRVSKDGDFAQVHHVLQSQIQNAPFPAPYNKYTPTGFQLDHLSLDDWIEQYVTVGHSSNIAMGVLR